MTKRNIEKRDAKMIMDFVLAISMVSAKRKRVTLKKKQDKTKLTPKKKSA